MSERAPNWWEQKWVKGVTYQLQAEGWLLKPYFNNSGVIEGKTFYFRIAGTGIATQRSDIFEERPVMNADRPVITGTMIPYEANDYVNDTDVTLMSEDELAVVQKTAAMAMGRKFDTVMMGLMAAQVSAGTISVIGNGATAIDPTQILTARDAILSQGTPGYDFILPLPHSWLSQLELFKQIANSQYVGDDTPLQKKVGTRQWGGITLVPLPDAYFATPVANSFDTYLYPKDAVGLVWNQNFKSRTDYIPTKKGWFAANDMAFGGAVLLPNAIKALRFANVATVPLAIPASN